jgi:hypothetical protein
VLGSVEEGWSWEREGKSGVAQKKEGNAGTDRTKRRRLRLTPSRGSLCLPRSFLAVFSTRWRNTKALVPTLRPSIDETRREQKKGEKATTERFERKEGNKRRPEHEEE